MTFTALLSALLLGATIMTNPSLPDPAEPGREDPIFMAAEGITAAADSVVSQWHEQQALTAYEDFFKAFIDLDSTVTFASDIPDSVYAARLKMIVSPISMPYNDVIKRYLIAYTTTKKSLLCNILGRSQYYFPMIEQELDRMGLPLELRMLPVIESALLPTARSHAGATGLWQFMYSTGKVYGMEITSFIDQRCDPRKATVAACRFLKDLYNMYGDWTLAIAAYNCGPGNVNKAIHRAGGEAKNFWDIYPYLPRETRGYLPSFIAATYAYTFHQQHNIVPAEAPLPLAVDTLHIDRLLHLEQIASTIGTPMQTLRQLNPQYKLDIIPAVGKTYTLTLPQCDVSKYIDNQQQILSKDTIYLAQYLKATNNPKDPKQFNITSEFYRVKSGDTLGAIARKYRVTVNQLMKWNNIKSPNNLRIGQRIEIFR